MRFHRPLFIGLLALLMSSTASANDGFYQGSGSTLIPVKNDGMRVVSEDLQITPIERRCYSIGPAPQSLEGVAGVPDKVMKECPKHLGGTLRVFWKAKARYEVIALKSQKDVLMAFPIMLDDFVGERFPGVARFQVTQNGAPLKNLELKWVEGLSPFDPEKTKTLAYSWKASFTKGKKYTLVTEYEFGADYQSAQDMWFASTRDENGDYPEGRHFYMMHMRYYLTPISSWASPPPDEIRAKVAPPLGVPVTYTQVGTSYYPALKPVCVDKEGLYFKLIKSFPSHDIMVSFPDISHEPVTDKDFAPIRGMGTYQAWMKGIGNPEKMGCSLAANLKASATDKELILFLENHKCVDSCSGGR